MATETLRPNAAGDETNLNVGAGGDNYANVDEVDSDEYTTFNYGGQQVDYLRDLYNVADHSVGSNTINYIKVYVNCRSSSSPDQDSIKIAIKSGSGAGAPDTVDESTPIRVGEVEAWRLDSNQWANNPATSVAWIWDEIDKLQIGVALRSSRSGGTFGTNVTQVYVEVDYTVPVTHYGAATLSGVGTLTGIGQGIFVGQATLSGTGTLSALAGLLLVAKATLSGIGTLSAIGSFWQYGKATLSGVGTLTASGFIVSVIKVTLALYSRAITATLHSRSLTSKLYARAITLLTRTK